MGIYLYRVTAKRVICSDGKPANVARYAYKPYSGMSTWNTQQNARMDFQTGCPVARKLAREGKLTDRIAIGDRVYGNPHNWGTFSDDNNLGTERMPCLSEISAPISVK